MKHSAWVYDLEQLKNCHSITAINRDTNEIIQFVIHESRNDIEAYLDFLKSCRAMIGFNNLNYDYPVLHFLINNANNFKDANHANQLLYSQSQKIISDDNSSIPYWKIMIPQLDLFRIHHYNNKQRSTSLKAVEIALRMDNIQDMPFPHYHTIKDDEIDTLLDYNLNDVYATLELYNESRDKIDFRKRMNKIYNINCINYPDVKIGEEILIIENASALNIDKKELKKMRTIRDKICLKDVILPHISFDSDEFNGLLDKFKNMITDADDIKGSIKEIVYYDDVKYEYGLGGIHGAYEPGVYRSDDEGDLIYIDVSSYYPNLAIKNKFYPEHLSDKFCEVGDKLYKQRMQAKQDGDSQMVSAIKLALNGALFGKSNDKFSPMYDPQFMLSITINGQLLLTMLSEQISNNGIRILQVNTDSVLVKCSKEKREILDQLCQDWMKITNLKLDYDFFSILVQRDVNNYISKHTSGKIKYKGCFEIDKDYHKDHSMRIVRIALREYFLNGVPTELTIHNHLLGAKYEGIKNYGIYDFCMVFKGHKKKDMVWKLIGMKGIKEEIYQRTNRYYISMNGVYLFKSNNEDDRIISLQKNWKATMFNKFVEKEDYNINYRFYISECHKIIDAIQVKENTLWQQV